MVICNFRKLYGIQFKAAKVDTWQEEVEYYDVVDQKQRYWWFIYG